jgi:hypothetical protein
MTKSSKRSKQAVADFVNNIVIIEGTDDATAQKIKQKIAEEVLKEREAEAEQLWREYCATHTLPPDIPENPDEVYRDKWQGWCEWIGAFDDNL